jgi:hypothetical protein
LLKSLFYLYHTFRKMQALQKKRERKTCIYFILWYNILRSFFGVYSPFTFKLFRRIQMSIRNFAFITVLFSLLFLAGCETAPKKDAPPPAPPLSAEERAVDLCVLIAMKASSVSARGGVRSSAPQEGFEGDVKRARKTQSIMINGALQTDCRGATLSGNQALLRGR